MIGSISHAGFLRIVSDPNLILMEEGSEIYLQGEFKLENQGNEMAKDVFPSFHIDHFTVSMEKRNLQPNESYTWNLKAKLDRSRLCVEKGPGCLVALPAEGDFLVHIEKNYQDQNSYPFAVPDILNLSYNKKGSVKTGFELINIKASISTIGPNEFETLYEIENLTGETLKVGLRYLLPKEVEMTTALVPLELGPRKKISGQIWFKNKTGLVGSDYLSLLVAETVEAGQRKFAWGSQHFKIEKFIPKPSIWSPFVGLNSAKMFFWVWGIFSVLALGSVLVFWLLPIRKIAKRN